MTKPGDIQIVLTLCSITPEFVELKTSIREQLADDAQGTKQDQVHLAHSQTLRADQLFLRLQDATNSLAHRAVNILNNRKKG